MLWRRNNGAIEAFESFQDFKDDREVAEEGNICSEISQERVKISTKSKFLEYQWELSN